MSYRRIVISLIQHDCVWALNLQITSNNVYLPVNSKLCTFPVENIPSGHSLPRVHVQDRAGWEDRVPHTDVRDLPDITLVGIKIPHVSVWILSNYNLASRSDSVTLLVNFGQAFPPIHEEGSRTWSGIPGDTQMGLQGPELRDLKENTLSTQVKAQSKHRDMKMSGKTEFLIVKLRFIKANIMSVTWKSQNYC